MKTNYKELRAHVAATKNTGELNAAIRLIQRRYLEKDITRGELYCLLDFTINEHRPKIN